MATIKRFEEMLCWQAARDLVKLVYQLTKNERFKRDYDLVNQIRRSAVSSMANMAEGFVEAARKISSNFLIIPGLPLRKRSVIVMWLLTRATFQNQN